MVITTYLDRFGVVLTVFVWLAADVGCVVLLEKGNTRQPVGCPAGCEDE